MMKFSRIANLCKKHKIINVIKHESETWIGTRAAMFKCDGEIQTDKSGLLTLLNIPQEKDEEYDVNFDDIKIRDVIGMAKKDGGTQITEIPVDIAINGSQVMICATDIGAVLFNKKIVNIVQDDCPQLSLFEYNGLILLAAVTDSGLAAVISPMKLPADKEMKEIERMVSQLKLARMNSVNMPEEPEQIEIDDYPFDEKNEYDE